MDERIIKFQELAELKWVLLSKNESKKANQAFDRLVHIAKQMKDKNELDLLEILLDCEIPGVRLEAACILLTQKIHKAEIELESLSKSRGMIAFTAEMTLKQWRLGKLSF